MSAANPNPMEKSMVSLLLVANTGGGVAVDGGDWWEFSAISGEEDLCI
jgi:hypothetical protein